MLISQEVLLELYNHLQHYQQLKRWPQCHAPRLDVYDLAPPRRMVFEMTAFIRRETCDQVPQLPKVTSNTCTVQELQSKLHRWLAALYQLRTHLKILCRSVRLKSPPYGSRVRHHNAMQEMMSKVRDDVEPIVPCLAPLSQMATVQDAFWS